MLRGHSRSIYDRSGRRFAIRYVMRFLHSSPPAVRPMDALSLRYGRHILIAVVGVLQCCSFGCERAAPLPAQSNTIEVVAANPAVKQIVEWDDYTARLEAIEFVMIRARVGGYLQSIHFTEGDLVQQGDLLFVIDPRPYEAIVNQGEAAVRQAKAQEVEAKSTLARMHSQKKVAQSQFLFSRL